MNADKYPDKPQANERQVGGHHYRTSAIQHWDLCAARHYDYFQGQITKYLDRWKVKGGVSDLRKAQHFLEKYIEVAHMFYADTPTPTVEPPPAQRLLSYDDLYQACDTITKLSAKFNYIGAQGKSARWECKACKKEVVGVNLVEAAFAHFCPLEGAGPTGAYVNQG